VTDSAEQQQAPATPPSCYRHPGRVTYVSCVRCGRSACPDCLRPASVGHQCLECIRAANRAPGGRPVGRFGGAASTRPLVTWVLVAVNILLYLVLLASPGLQNSWAMYGAGVAAGQWYRLLTSAFIPGLGGLGILDIALNMWVLLVVGPALERQLGWLRYLGIYLVSAVGGSVAFFLLTPPSASAVGASGAIFGLFGAWFVVARRLRLDSRQIVFLIVINLAFGFLVPGIAWQAHLGGLIAGAVLMAAYAYAPRHRRGAIQLVATAAVLALLALAVILRDHQLAGAVLG
jgi:membrane associated rhomboid family serine protease